MGSLKNTVALIVAAGSGSRVGGQVPKQFRMIAGKPLLRHSYEAFVNHSQIEKIFVVVALGHEVHTNHVFAGLPPPILVIGGESRRESVRNGLLAIAEDGGADFVLIHDAARAFLSATTIDSLIAALGNHDGAVPALPVVDSLARGEDTMQATVERAGLWRIQTPQAFHFDAILNAHRIWDPHAEATDDARMLMAKGGEVAFVPGDERLMKYTFAFDFDDFKTGASQQMRIGTGFDVHRLVKGEDLWLCGVKLDYPLGLLGFSDADVAMHAITDAILGALAMGDIGDHFPPSDPKWRGASSDQFLLHAMQLANERSYSIGNIDVTIMCEAPKIGPHRQKMRARIAELLCVEIDQISVKATTTERLGFTGRGEGIAAQAIASLVKLD